MVSTKILICTSLSIFLFPCTSRSEYRAYQYLITPLQTESGEVSTEISSLNPVGFQRYKGGRETHQVDLLRTWICPGNTGRKEICPSPYKSVSVGDLRE